jgi:hypothetical protein
MKPRANWLIIPAVALGLGACNKKEEVKAPDAPAAAAIDVSMKDATVPPPAVKAPLVNVDERAAKLGFAKHLTADTEAAISFYNGSKTAERVENSKLWKLVQEQMGGGMMMGPDANREEFDIEEEDIEMDAEQADVMQDEPMIGAAAGGIVDGIDPDGTDATLLSDEEPVGPAALLGNEVTLAMGKTTGEQLGNLLTFSQRMNYYQFRSLAKSLVASVKSGDTSDLEDVALSGGSEETFKELLKDPKSGMDLLEKSHMPPIYVAFRTTPAQQAAAAMEVASMLENLGMMGPAVEPLEFELAGHKFGGHKVSGAKVSEMMAEERADMEEELDAATVDQLLALVAKKNLVVASGTVGDYVLVVIGGATEDFKLADSPADSLVAGDALAFADGYLDQEITAVSYGQKEMLQTLTAASGGIAEMANGLRDGLAGAEGIGDTRDLEAMFQIVAEREKALLALSHAEATGMVAFFEEGLKIESFGGTDRGAVDWKATNKLSHLGDSEGVLMFADMTTDAAYSEKSRAYLEALMETSYAMIMKLANLPMEDGEMEQFQGMAKVFDEKFRPDAVALWDAFSQDFGGSLGHESALVIDVKGSAPAVPGVPQEVVDEAKVPRIAVISPVTDRAKLAGSWDKMNTTLTSTLAKVSEMTGSEIPMQKPLSSEKDGNITWFFPMPFFTDDFLPSVTVGDQWFVASTSKMQALDLINQANAGGESRDGAWFSFNFNTLRKYADETLALIDKHAEKITGAPMSPEDKKSAQDVISLFDGMDVMTVHARQDGGVQRSSIHFKTR